MCYFLSNLKTNGENQYFKNIVGLTAPALKTSQRCFYLSDT
jgi:hypothetical protein